MINGRRSKGLELIVEHDRLVADLQHHRQQIASSGVASTLRRAVHRWRLEKDKFSWSNMCVMRLVATAIVRHRKYSARLPACGASSMRKPFVQLATTRMRHTECLVMAGHAKR